MPKFVDVEPLDRKFEERYLDYRNRSQSELFTGKFRVDDELTTAAMIMGSCLDSLREAPAADVAPVRHARWELTGADKRGRGGNWECTGRDGCGKSYPYKCDFCPNCGAKMDGGVGNA